MERGYSMKKPLDTVVKKFLFDTFELMAKNGDEIEVRRTVIRYLENGTFNSDDVIELNKMLDRVRESISMVEVPDGE